MGMVNLTLGAIEAETLINRLFFWRVPYRVLFHGADYVMSVPGWVKDTVRAQTERV